jgi:hypothetical protein
MLPTSLFSKVQRVVIIQDPSFLGAVKICKAAEGRSVAMSM